jgi:hypothetical protein
MDTIVVLLEKDVSTEVTLFEAEKLGANAFALSTNEEERKRVSCMI